MTEFSAFDADHVHHNDSYILCSCKKNLEIFLFKISALFWSSNGFCIYDMSCKDWLIYAVK